MMARFDSLNRFNFKIVMRATGVLLLVMAASMVLPIAASLHYRDGAQFDLALSALTMGAMGLLLRNILGRDPDYTVSERESFWITAFVWLVIPAVGAVPYLFTGAAPRVVDALFESYAGFTTSGSSALSFSHRVPEGLLVWRSMTQWIGGLGLILFVVAALRRLRASGAGLYDAEFSGTVQRRLRPHMAATVGTMWRVYIVLTVALLTLLLVLGNNPLHAFCITLSTVSTGGFLPAPDALEAFGPVSLLAVALFMLLSGVNIALLFYIMTLRPRAAWRDEELHVYLCAFLAVAVVCAVALLVRQPVFGAGRAVTSAIFHAASAISTCGYAYPHGGALPMMARALIVLLLLAGASSGSTGGALKWKRVMALMKHMRNYMLRTLHPASVRAVTLNHTVIDEGYVSKILAFVFLYIVFIVTGGFVLVVCGLDIPTALLTAAANIGNTGTEAMLHSLGAEVTYASLPALGKFALMALMLLGRVEIFAFVAIFSPAYWRRR